MQIMKLAKKNANNVFLKADLEQLRMRSSKQKDFNSSISRALSES